MPSPTWGLDPANIVNLLGDDFEFFVGQVLDFETKSRHDGARLSGPPARFRHDGGEDLEVVVLRQPIQTAANYGETLTGDAPGRYHFCCQTGAEWRAGLKSDALKDRSLDTIAEGGWLVLVIHLRLAPVDHGPVVTEISEAIAARTGRDAALVAQQIVLKDANKLASSLADHPFMLHPDTRATLGLPILDGLVDTEEWLVKHGEERALPSFVADEFRTGALAQLSSLVDAGADDPNVAWVWGPPGAGKTRLVAEAIHANPTARMRALFSEDVDSGIRTIRSDELPKRPGALLIVDECPRDEVEALAASFLARARGQGGTLILIGPQSGSGPLPNFRGVSLQVQPLDPPAARRLIEVELGLAGVAPPGLVERVLALTEGYPWFAVLLARALRADPLALPDGSTEWDAAALAIAGPERDYGGSKVAWHAEVQRRAKTLIAVILTEGIDWRALATAEEEALSAAVGLPWQDVKDCAQVCAERGIIRVRQNWRFKYVTPNNLARVVACHLFSGSDPPSRRIRVHAPKLADGLFHKLQLLDVPPVLLGSLADEALEPLADAPLSELGLLALTFLAKQRPAAVARTLRRAIDASPIDELRTAEGIRRNLVFALNHVCRRRDGFEDAEAALFRLALAENETWGNNATGVWKDLFLGALSLTHRDFNHRLNILERRLTQGDDVSRMLALQGLDRAVGGEGVGPGYTDDDKIDGDWPMPTVGEVRLGKERAWKLLLLLTDDALLSHRAREIATKSVWGAAYWGVAELALEGLAEHVATWTEKERAELRETLGNMQRGEREIPPAVETLNRALEPKNYHANLLDVVGQWMPLGAREAPDHFAAERSLDRELALRGLADPEFPLADEVEWLETEEAVRSEAFMIAVGSVDEARRLLPRLISRVEIGAATRTFPAYVAGVAEAGGGTDVDDLLRSWRSDDRFAAHTLLTIWRIGPTDERIGWLTEDIDAKRVDASSCGILAFGSWSARASPEQLQRLISSLVARDELTTSLAALWIALDDYSSAAPIEAAEIIANLAVRVASGPLTGMGSYKWREACLWLARIGSAHSAAQAALTAIRSAEHYGMDDDAWAVVTDLAKSTPEAIWDGLAQMLEDSPDDAYRIVLEAQSHGISSALPAARILNWVGQDKSRSLLAAHMCDVHDAELGALPAGLLERFGPESPAARELAARAHSTVTPVGSLAGFARRQLENARAWARDPRPAVAAWGKEMVEELHTSYDYHDAQEEYEQRNRK